jgi:hypothetical protein
MGIISAIPTGFDKIPLVKQKRHFAEQQERSIARRKQNLLRQ